MKKALVAGHADFAQGMISAASQITGVGGNLIPFSNARLGREEIAAELKNLVDKNDVAVIFTDLPSGSVTIEARRLAREIPGLAVVTGLNLPVLIDYLLCRSNLAENALEQSVQRGRAALSVIPSA